MAKLSRSHRWKNPCELPTYLQFLEGTSYLKLKGYTFECSLFLSLNHNKGGFYMEVF